jgi:hypothetical protein
MESLDKVPEFNVVHHCYLMNKRICDCIPKKIKYDCRCILYIYNTDTIHNKLIKRCRDHGQKILNMYDPKFKLPFTQLIIDINEISLEDNKSLKRKCECDHHNEKETNALKKIKK